MTGGGDAWFQTLLVCLGLPNRTLLHCSEDGRTLQDDAAKALMRGQCCEVLSRIINTKFSILLKTVTLSVSPGFVSPKLSTAQHIFAG